MAVAVLLTFAFLTYQVNSQIVGIAPSFSLPRGFEPTPCASDPYRPPASVGIEPCLSIQALPNVIPTSPQITNIKPFNPPCCSSAILNLPTPSCNSNPVNNQPVLKPIFQTQTIANNCPPKCSNVQVTPICAKAAPSIMTNPSPPVVTVVDNTLANSLANALQLLLISNLLDSCGSSNPCDIPDCNVPAISCEYFGNVCSEPVFSCSEPIYSCPDVTPCPDIVYSCPEPVVSCPEPVVTQSYPGNFGGYSVVESPGCQCSANPVYLETPTRYVAKACEAGIPAVAEIAPLAMEVPFPASIPAQLVCNFGLSPSNQPVVTFNVEAMPCGNVFGSYS